MCASAGVREQLDCAVARARAIHTPCALKSCACVWTALSFVIVSMQLYFVVAVWLRGRTSRVIVRGPGGDSLHVLRVPGFMILRIPFLLTCIQLYYCNVNQVTSCRQALVETSQPGSGFDWGGRPTTKTKLTPLLQAFAKILLTRSLRVIQSIAKGLTPLHSGPPHSAIPHDFVLKQGCAPSRRHSQTCEREC
mgnify:CR=1 FL=1